MNKKKMEHWKQSQVIMKMMSVKMKKVITDIVRMKMKDNKAQEMAIRKLWKNKKKVVTPQRKIYKKMTPEFNLI